jgi:hypothetical protein
VRPTGSTLAESGWTTLGSMFPTGSSWRLGGARLDEQGVTNSGIIEDENGLHLNAKDPDNIALEFFYMPPQG